MLAEQFLQAILPQIAMFGGDRLPTITKAGELVAGALANGHRIWMAQTTHCLHGEATYRAGGLMAVHILDDPIVVEPGDIVIEGTPAGTSGLAIETALGVKARGATLIALTQLVYEQDPRIVLQHSSGKRLHEIADLTIDLGGSYGDGELDLLEPGLRVFPSSGITAMVAMWMIFADATERLTAQGLMPLIWQSVLVPGATERNARLRERYVADRSGVMSLGEVRAGQSLG
jgi:uncharacterized phosphosugar-binding protein